MSKRIYELVVSLPQRENHRPLGTFATLEDAIDLVRKNAAGLINGVSSGVCGVEIREWGQGKSYGSKVVWSRMWEMDHGENEWVVVVTMQSPKYRVSDGFGDVREFNTLDGLFEEITQLLLDFCPTIKIDIIQDGR